MGASGVEPPVLPTMQRHLDSLKATEVQQDGHRPSAQDYKLIEHQLELLMRAFPPAELQRPSLKDWEADSISCSTFVDLPAPK